MKEHFRDWKFKTLIKVSYKDNTEQGLKNKIDEHVRKSKEEQEAKEKAQKAKDSIRKLERIPGCRIKSRKTFAGADISEVITSRIHLCPARLNDVNAKYSRM